MSNLQRFLLFLLIIILISVIEEFIVSLNIKQSIKLNPEIQNYTITYDNKLYNIKILTRKDYKYYKPPTNFKLIEPKFLISTRFKLFIKSLFIQPFNKYTIFSDTIIKIVNYIIPLINISLPPTMDFKILIDKSFNHDIITDTSYLFIV